MQASEDDPPSCSPSALGKPAQGPMLRWIEPLIQFLHVEAASGFFLLGCTILALVLANSPWAAPFARIWQTPIRLRIDSFQLDRPLIFLINDGLMTVFFFVVGLEIKRELVTGELREPKKAALPVLAAAGGMIMPAAIYLFLQAGRPGHAGWGIPIATDIAFVIGFLAILGHRVPLGLKVLLLSLAIADDIGAVLVIAFCYSTGISWGALAWGGAGFGLIYLFQRIGIRRVLLYLATGSGIWFAFLESGVHPTIAGILLGLATPAYPWTGEDHEAMRVSGPTARAAISPLDRLEHLLHPWVSFLILPLFALANAGVIIEPSKLGDPIALAVAAGLILGKPVGIVLASWIAVKSRLASLPANVNWRIMIGAGCLAGIGFTMSIFVANLALDGVMLEAGKLGTLMGSMVSAALGSLLLLAFLKPSSTLAKAAIAKEY